MNDISNFITHAIPGLAGQIIAGIVIGALFSLLQLIPGVNVAVDTAIGITIMAATMGAAVQQYYLSGISDWKTIAFDIAKSFATPEGIAALLSGVGFSIGLPRVVDNIGDLFKTTDNVKVSGVVKSLDKAKIDLDNIQTKVGGSLKNLKLDKTNIDVARVSEVLGKIRDLNNLPSIEGVLRDIENNIRDMEERLNGIVKIDAEVKVGPEGAEVYTTDLTLLGKRIASL
ncbi:MAG: hypothetical protein QXF80_07375, partial [Thermoplasmatales archaeon]